MLSSRTSGTNSRTGVNTDLVLLILNHLNAQSVLSAASRNIHQLAKQPPPRVVAVKSHATRPKVQRIRHERISAAAKIAAAVREDEKASSPYAANVPKITIDTRDTGVGTSPRGGSPSPRVGSRKRKEPANTGIVVEEADPMDVSPKYKEVAQITTRVCRGEEYTVRSRSGSPRGIKKYLQKWDLWWTYETASAISSAGRDDGHGTIPAEFFNYDVEVFVHWC